VIGAPGVPLWLVVAVWWLDRTEPARTGPQAFEYEIRLRVLADLRDALPVPPKGGQGGLAGKFRRWLMIEIIGWIERERNTLITLRAMGLGQTFTVHIDSVFGKGGK
jgi:hypothetical protein